MLYSGKKAEIRMSLLSRCQSEWGKAGSMEKTVTEMHLHE